MYLYVLVQYVFVLVRYVCMTCWLVQVDQYVDTIRERC